MTLANLTVQFVSLASRLTATRSLKMKHECYITLSAGGDRVFVAIQEENIGVVILDIQGNGSNLS
jgi:hypothetical protein